nr:Uncharacterised protein [Klebsiella pneumoniae]
MSKRAVKEVFMVRTTASVMELKVPYYSKCSAGQHPTLRMSLLMTLHARGERAARGV